MFIICRHNLTNRAGLAPLELVLSIPLVLMVMALSVAVGTAACWKMRADVVARDAVFNQRWPRHAWAERRPSGWPRPASVSHENSLPLAELNSSVYSNPLLRGPLPNGIIVDDELFDPTGTVIVGKSHIHRRPPLLPRLIHYQLDVEMPLLDEQWQYRQLGLSSNTTRRIPQLYRFPNSNPGLAAAFQQSTQAIQTSPLRFDLSPLDRDLEFLNWAGHARDFHPKAKKQCGLSLESARETVVKPLVERVDGQPPPGQPTPKQLRGVPAQMAKAFQRMYRAQLAELQNSAITATPEQVAGLQSKIDTLQQFLDSLN